MYWLVSEFTCTAKETPRVATPHVRNYFYITIFNTPLQRLSGDVHRGVRRPFVSPVMSSAKKARLEKDQVVRRRSSSTPTSSNKELLVERRHLIEKIKEKEVKLKQLKNAEEMEKVSKSYISCVIIISSSQENWISSSKNGGKLVNKLLNNYWQKPREILRLPWEKCCITCTLILN